MVLNHIAEESNKEEQDWLKIEKELNERNIRNKVAEYSKTYFRIFKQLRVELTKTNDG